MEVEEQVHEEEDSKAVVLDYVENVEVQAIISEQPSLHEEADSIEIVKNTSFNRTEIMKDTSKKSTTSKKSAASRKKGHSSVISQSSKAKTETKSVTSS